MTTALFDKLPEDMTESQYTVVRNLLKNYDDVFSRGVFDMLSTSLVEHVIDTGDHRPIRQRLRRHLIAHLDAIDQQVDDLLRDDFIEPAAGPWASNVVLVRKKDGSHRLCVCVLSIAEFGDLQGHLSVAAHRHMSGFYGWCGVVFDVGFSFGVPQHTHQRSGSRQDGVRDASRVLSG